MLNLIVKKKSAEAEGIFRFELIARDGGWLPSYAPGAHIDLHLPHNMVRQYSLCMPMVGEHADTYTLAVLREPDSRGGSRTLHERVHEGMHLQASAPRNLFALAPAASRSLLVAGGIGITPLLCMAQDLASRAQDFDLHYCCRRPERAAFTQLLRESGFSERVHFHFDDARPLDVRSLLAQPEPRRHLYVCGPGGFMRHVLDTAQACGWSDHQLHREYFAAGPAADTQDRPFEVEIASTGAVHAVPVGRSAFEVLDAAGLQIPVSCEQGICGACVTGVLAGEPEHRDQFLTPAEQALNRCFTPCCSRARSARLVLDL